jgi:hypothetical protein
MSRNIATHLKLLPLLQVQDFVISREQAFERGLTRGAVDDRLASKAWQVVLPSVYFAGSGTPTRRQKMIAALLYAGHGSAIDDVDACRFHGIKAAAVDHYLIHVVVPWGSPARSHDYVRIRRTSRPIEAVVTSRLRYVDPATAVIAAARRVKSDRTVLALISDAVQRNVATVKQLMCAQIAGPPRNARRADAALAQVGAGIRSAPEGDFRTLAEASAILPPLLYNRSLLLPNRQIICPDALAPDAPLVHETNGRRAHKRLDLFEDMQVRHEVMTSVGLIAFHTSPRRLALHGGEVVRAFERAYLREAGKGLPAGVVLLPEVDESGNPMAG